MRSTRMVFINDIRANLTAAMAKEFKSMVATPMAALAVIQWPEFVLGDMLVMQSQTDAVRVLLDDTTREFVKKTLMTYVYSRSLKIA